jgi:hypothetical protein
MFLKQNNLVRNANANKEKMDQNELHKMIIKDVYESMQTMFKQMHQHHHLDDSDNLTM